jgi:hypothetical protein
VQGFAALGISSVSCRGEITPAAMERLRTVCLHHAVFIHTTGFMTMVIGKLKDGRVDMVRLAERHSGLLLTQRFFAAHGRKLTKIRNREMWKVSEKHTALVNSVLIRRGNIQDLLPDARSPAVSAVKHEFEIKGMREKRIARLLKQGPVLPVIPAQIMLRENVSKKAAGLFCERVRKMPEKCLWELGVLRHEIRVKKGQFQKGRNSTRNIIVFASCSLALDEVLQSVRLTFMADTVQLLQ